jgi:hypothetical protein
MYLSLFMQDIKKIFLLIAFQQCLNSGQKTADFCRYWQILVKNHCRFTAGDLKVFFIFFCFDFLHIDPRNDFCFCKFFAKGLKSEGERLKVEFWSSEMAGVYILVENGYLFPPPPRKSIFFPQKNSVCITASGS